MSSVRRVLLTIALGTAIGAGPAIAAPATAKPNDNKNWNNNSRELAAVLRGSQASGMGDPDGWGLANVRVRSNGQVCYQLLAGRLSGTYDANIYYNERGDDNDASDVRVELRTPSSGWAQGCKWVKPLVARNMMKNPSDYNVEIFADSGAVRGQLFRNGGNNNHW
jgi:hypothetical protein